MARRIRSLLFHLWRGKPLPSTPLPPQTPAVEIVDRSGNFLLSRDGQFIVTRSSQ